MMVLFFLVIVRLFTLQVVQKGFWEREALKARTTGRTIPYELGWILDRNLTPLAVSESTYDLRFVFGNFRKESVVGQINMVYTLLNGTRPAFEAIYENPAPFVDEILALTLDSVASLDDAQKTEDILFYLGRILTPEGGRRLAVMGKDISDRPFAAWPSFEGVRASICSRVQEERAALDALERELHIPPETLRKRPGASAARADFRVRSRIEREGAAYASYRMTRRFHSQYDYYEEFVLQKIPHSAVMTVVVNERVYPGFYVVESTQRLYPPGLADICPTLIGKMRQPSESHLQAWETHRQRLAELSFIENKTEEEMLEVENLQIWLREIDVHPGEEVGAFGLELLLEPILRGKRGYVFIERDRFNRSSVVREFTPPVRGQDVILTLDAGLQRACKRVLSQAGHKGAIVLMNSETGAILAMATNPQPTRIEMSREYGKLMSDPDRPLLQRAINGWDLPPPGSVFKLVTAVAALEEGRITPDAIFNCEHRLMVGNTTMRCEGTHLDIDLTTALFKSCNIYFYHLSHNLDYPTLFEWAQKFGFGARTSFLDPELYGAVFRSGGVREAPCPLKLDERGVANLMRLCIGQGAIDDVTPLQVARMISALATGYLPQPYLIRQIGDREIPVPERKDMGISPETLEFIREAMRLVVVEGTARPDSALNLNLLPYRAAGKTGTAQVASGPSHAWFAGFLPYERPILSFAVLVESCGLHGGDIAAPLLQRVLEQPEAEELLKEIER
jgi:cell division protein FtsI/penicillin-binding protein 2